YQGKISPVPAEVIKEEELRDNQGLPRDEHRYNHYVEQRFPSAEVHSREGIGDKGARDQDPEDIGEDDKEGVDRVPEEREQGIHHHPIEVVPVPIAGRKPLRWNGIYWCIIGLEGCGEHPPHW